MRFGLNAILVLFSAGQVALGQTVGGVQPARSPSCEPNSTLVNIFGLCVENKINLSLAATILLFFLGYAIAKLLEGRARVRARRIYLLALLQEIALNVNSLTDARGLFPPAADLQKFVRKEPVNGTAPRPFITFNYSSVIFRTRTEVLQDLEEALVRNIIDFYARLEGIETDIAGIDKKSYDTISLEGRDAIFADLRRDLEVCLVVGLNVDSGVRLYLKLA